MNLKSVLDSVTELFEGHFAVAIGIELVVQLVAIPVVHLQCLTKLGSMELRTCVTMDAFVVTFLKVLRPTAIFVFKTLTKVETIVLNNHINRALLLYERIQDICQSLEEPLNVLLSIEIDRKQIQEQCVIFNGETEAAVRTMNSVDVGTKQYNGELTSFMVGATLFQRSK